MFLKWLEHASEDVEGAQWEGRHCRCCGHHHGGSYMHSPRFPGWRGHPRFFGRGGPFGPKGPFGSGGPFGPGGPFGDGGNPGFPGGKRFFGRGDLKYALLELLMERPMHGYEMIKTLQERSGGKYAASPGSVYPTLQMLEDRGFVTVIPSEGKKVYSITDDGRAFLAEGRSNEHDEHGRRDFWPGQNDDWSEVSALWQELRACGPLLMSALRSARRDQDKIRRLKLLLERIRGELAEIAGTPIKFDA